MTEKLDRLSLRIREASEEDLPALEWDGEFTRFRRLYKDAMREAKKGRRIILVAEIGNDVIGQLFVNFHSTWRNRFLGKRTGYLHSFRVKPAFRSRGIGRSLIATAESMLKQRGYNRSVISVAQSNEAALKLYQDLGYQVYRKDPGQWSFMDHRNQVHHISEPAFILQKNL